MVPCWPSAIFWPCIVNEDGSFRIVILLTSCMLLKGSVFLHVRGSNKKCTFG